MAQSTGFFGLVVQGCGLHGLSVSITAPVLKSLELLALCLRGFTPPLKTKHAVIKKNGPSY